VQLWRDIKFGEFEVLPVIPMSSRDELSVWPAGFRPRTVAWWVLHWTVF
jgi:hypothetical protein